MSGLNPVDVVEEDAADLLFPKGLHQNLYQKIALNMRKEISKEQKLIPDLSALNIDPFSCNACAKCKTVLYEPFVSCAECFELFCLSCFSKGSETSKHKSDHSYNIQRDDFILFASSDWTAREEKVFLNLIQSYGVGNWDEISSFMVRKSAEQCRFHFYNFYFDGIFAKQLGLSNENAYTRHNVPYLLKTNSLEPPRGDEKNFISQSMAGYRFARSDFDIPYDSSAESILNKISFDEDEVFENDHDMKEFTTELNCALFRAYNHRAKERKRRYHVMKNHGLILQRKTLAWLSKYSEMFSNHSSLGKFSTFMQISDPTSFDFLMESLKHFFDKKRHLYR